MTHTDIKQVTALTDTEQQLLNTYRQLDDTGKRLAIQFQKEMLKFHAQDRIIPLSLFDEGR